MPTGNINGTLTTPGKLSGILTAGVGGTSDYAQLENKPSINNNELIGNKGGHDLGLANLSDIPTIPQIITPFIDFTNLIVPRTSYYGGGSVEYTATVDCCVICEVANAQYNGSKIEVEGQNVGGVSYADTLIQISQAVFLKSGQKIKLTSSFAAAAVGYTVYGIIKY